MASHPVNHAPSQTPDYTEVWAEPRPPSQLHESPGGDDTLTVEDSNSIDALETEICKTSNDTSAEAGSHGNGMTNPPEAEVDARGDVNLDFSQVDSASGNNHTTAYVRQQTTPYRRIRHPADSSVMWSFIVSLVFLVAYVVVFCPVVALLLVFVPIGYVIKRGAACCCCCAQHRTCACCCSHLLTATDTFWLHDSPFNRMVVQCLLELETGLDNGHICDLVNTRLLTAQTKGGRKLYPRFTQKVVPVYSGFAWEDDVDFCMSKHTVTIPASTQSEAQLQEYIAEMAARPLPRDRPLWEIHLLQGFGEGATTMMLFRVSPCVTDGISLVRILCKALADGHEPLCLKPRFGGSAFFFNIMRAVFVGPLVFLQRWIFTRSDQNTLHGPPLSGSKVVAWSEPYNLAKAVRIKQVTRSTFNDIILAVVTGCLRLVLQKHGMTNPRNIRAAIPIDLRSDTSHIHMGNEYVLLDMKLPANTEGTIPRLWDIKRCMDEVKNSADPTVMYGSKWVLFNSLPQFLCYRIWRSLYSKVTAVIANLPGPSAPLTLASHQVRSLLYWTPPREHVGVSISILTYADQLRIAVIADKAVLPDPEIITKDFNQQVNYFVT